MELINVRNIRIHKNEEKLKLGEIVYFTVNNAQIDSRKPKILNNYNIQNQLSNDYDIYNVKGLLLNSKPIQVKTTTGKFNGVTFLGRLKVKEILNVTRHGSSIPIYKQESFWRR